MDLWRDERNRFRTSVLGPSGDETLTFIDQAAHRLLKTLSTLGSHDAEPLGDSVVSKGHLDALWESMQYEMAAAALGQLERAEDRFPHLIALMRQFSPCYKAQPYLRRATACYLSGFDVECVVLCRSAIEQQFTFSVSTDDCNEVLGDRPSRRDGTAAYDLYERIHVAEKKGIIDASIAATAHEIRDLANRLLHRFGQLDGDCNYAFVTLRGCSEVLTALG